MAISAPTKLAVIASNTAAQTQWNTGSLSFPAASLGIIFLGISGSVTAAGWTVAGTGGETWTVVAAADNAAGTGTHSAFAYCYFSGSTTTTVTVSFTSVNWRTGWIGYVTGTDTVPLDQTGTATTSTGVATVTVTTSGNLAQDNEIVLAAYTAYQNNTGPTTFPTTGYTAVASAAADANPTDATRSRVSAFEYKLLGAGTSGATQSTTFAVVTNNAQAASIATFKAAVSGTTYTKTGSLVAGGGASGADAFTSTEAGSLIAGSSSTAADAFTPSRTGSLAPGGLTSAADVRIAVETGSLATNTLTAAADEHTAARTGSLAPSALVSGVSTVGGPVTIVTVRLGPPSPSAAELAGAPGANAFGPPSPRRI